MSLGSLLYTRKKLEKRHVDACTLWLKGILLHMVTPFPSSWCGGFADSGACQCDCRHKTRPSISRRLEWPLRNTDLPLWTGLLMGGGGREAKQESPLFSLELLWVSQSKKACHTENSCTSREGHLCIYLTYLLSAPAKAMQADRLGGK